MFSKMVLVVALIGLQAQFVNAQPSNAAGKWKLTIQFDSGANESGLELKIAGKKITGRFIAAFAGGEVPVEGEIEGETITFTAATTGGPHPGMQLDFSATLKGTDTLSGKLAAPFGEFAFTGERVP